MVDGANVGSPVALSAGKASLAAISTLSTTQHSVRATYSGNSHFKASASSVLNQRVLKATTTTKVTSAHNPSVHGKPVTFTATVAVSAPGSGTPKGSVQFKVNGANAGAPVALSAGRASATITGLRDGKQTITAVYGGATNFAASTGTMHQTVGGRVCTTSTVITASRDTVRFGHLVTFTARVRAGPQGPGLPTGRVQWKVDGRFVGRAVRLDASGEAIWTTSRLRVGVHYVRAVYLGRDLFTSSRSTVLRDTVRPRAHHD